MKRRGPALIALAAAGLALAGPTPTPTHAADAPGPHLARSFTITADAFPAEPAPGANQTTLGIRPVSTRAGARNPPAASFARAAASDMGLIEAYVGQQGPSAEADTAAANGRPDAHVEQGGMVLDAHASPLPKANASATGNDVPAGAFSFGSASSASSVDGSGAAITAVSWAEVQHAASGPLVIGSARFDAAASADGTPGGAKAAGRVSASNSTVAGVPVVIDEHGVKVNESAVPASQLPAATEAVRTALNRGGYMDVRVVQPAVEATPDGLRASVSGGGVRIRMATNDPTNNYFMEMNLVAGSAVASLGPVIGTVATGGIGGGAGSGPTGGGSPDPDGPANTGRILGSVIADAVGGVALGGLGGAPAAPGTGAGSGTGTVVLDDVVALSDADRYRLRGRWPGWPWLFLALVLVAAFSASLTTPPMAPARQRLSLFADRYLRG